MHSKENADMFADKKMVHLDPEMFNKYTFGITLKMIRN